MSRVGKKTIQIPGGVTADYNKGTLTVKGPLGEEKLALMKGIGMEIKGNLISITTQSDGDDKKLAAASGLVRSLVSNMVIGVSRGFERDLEIVGVGYRATQQNAAVQFQVGYSHPVVFNPPTGITIEVLDATKIKVKGVNKQQVGQVASDIRKLRPPEPYKGKGIRYKNEYIRKKAGKTGK
jgi:large subunit ribosomal protein L6